MECNETYLKQLRNSLSARRVRPTKMKAFFGLVAVIVFLVSCKGVSIEHSKTGRQIHFYFLKVSFGNANTTNKTKLQHLDNYSLLEICDYLELDDLVRLAASNERFHRIIADHYMVPIFRIHEKSVRFTNKIDQRPTPDTVFVKKFAEILLFLRNFGYLITKLTFAANAFSKENAFKINSFVVKYCSDSLVELELKQHLHMVSDNNKTFSKVIKLKL